MKFELTVLGCNAAVPMYGRHPSAQVLRVRTHLYLIDCGEGTQMRMNNFGVSRGLIRQIFISHLHGDHVFGLIGLLTSLSLQDRKASLDIFAPEGLAEIIEVFKKYSQVQFSYPLKINAIDTTQVKLIHEDNVTEVFTIPLIHGVPCAGFLFKEKQSLPSILPEAIQQYDIPFAAINNIKKGADFVTDKGEIVSHKALTVPAPPPRSFAYCSDTAYNPAIIDQIKGIDLLYHEATFLHEGIEKAEKYGHSTALQAAEIAAAAQVGQLLIGHYSSRYPNPKPLLDEAKSVFTNTIAVEEGQIYGAPYRKSSV